MWALMFIGHVFYFSSEWGTTSFRNPTVFYDYLAGDKYTTPDLSEVIVQPWRQDGVAAECLCNRMFAWMSKNELFMSYFGFVAIEFWPILIIIVVRFVKADLFGLLSPVDRLTPLDCAMKETCKYLYSVKIDYCFAGFVFILFCVKIFCKC